MNDRKDSVMRIVGGEIGFKTDESWLKFMAIPGIVVHGDAVGKYILVCELPQITITGLFFGDDSSEALKNSFVEGAQFLIKDGEVCFQTKAAWVKFLNLGLDVLVTRAKIIGDLDLYVENESINHRNIFRLKSDE